MNFDSIEKEGNNMRKVKETLKDLSGLKKAVANVPEEQRETATKILTEITFLQSTLETLKERINKEGPVIKTQLTTKENPALKAYNTSIMRYSQLLKQLTDILPEPPKEVPTDPLIDFIKGDS